MPREYKIISRKIGHDAKINMFVDIFF